MEKELIFIRHTLKLICQLVKDWKNAELETTGTKMAYNYIIYVISYKTLTINKL
jgi:hypothetical protein